jgi:uncharacterized protein YdaU (DUF1376 family)
MNYYFHHIGDFRSGSVNMTRHERWIYRDLLEVYYDTEAPLNLNLDVLCNEIGVRSDEERKIVTDLLRFKFECTERGYEHWRCETEIANYRVKSDAAKINGKLGGRPPKKANRNPEKPIGLSECDSPNTEKPSGLDVGYQNNPDLTRRNPAITSLQPNQEPITNNQEEPKEKTPRVPRFDAQAHLESMGVDPKISKDWLSLRKLKKLAPTQTAFEGVLSEAGKAGMTMEAALQTCCTRGWGSFNAAWLAKDPPRGGGTNFHDDRKRVMDELTGRNRNAAVDEFNIIDV